MLSEPTVYFAHRRGTIVGMAYFGIANRSAARHRVGLPDMADRDQGRVVTLGCIGCERMSDDDSRLYDRATTFHVLSRSPTDEAYWRGYLTGMRRRMAGGVTQDDLEAEAFSSMLRSAEPAPKALGRGYQDGIAGTAFLAGEG